MGGKAFHLDDGAFPRIPSSAYVILKNRFATILKTLYKHVETPIEAPEKVDHGDIDFLVCEPLVDDTLSKVQLALGARHANLVITHTSNFAVPADETLTGEPEGRFYQVDVHQCADVSELERNSFFHSYGDMGMILGLLARPYAFQLGVNGLKTHYANADDSHISSFLLSSSISDIMSFLELSMETYRRGFKTRDELFAWLQSSRFFKPQILIRAYPAMDKVAAKNQRSMYQAFVHLCETLVASSAEGERLRPRSNVDALREEALLFFGRKDEYDKIVRKNVLDRAYHEKFNGKIVMEWTGLNGLVIRDIMTRIRGQLSRDDIAQMDEDALRALVLDVQRSLPTNGGQNASS